jgi:hypothetical protein
MPRRNPSRAGAQLERPQPRSREDERVGGRQAAADHREERRRGCCRAGLVWRMASWFTSGVRGWRSDLTCTHPTLPEAAGAMIVPSGARAAQSGHRPGPTTTTITPGAELTGRSPHRAAGRVGPADYHRGVAMTRGPVGGAAPGTAVPELDTCGEAARPPRPRLRMCGGCETPATHAGWPGRRWPGWPPKAPWAWPRVSRPGRSPWWAGRWAAVSRHWPA